MCSKLPVTAPPLSRIESPAPLPGVTLPSFDNTLGALFIGSSLATLLYGIFCLQMFIYVTSYRTREDSRWNRLSMLLILYLVDTVQQVMMTATMYKLLVSDFANPYALASAGLAAFTYAQSIAGSCGVLLTQLFFSWRLWVISRRSLHVRSRVIISTLTMMLALFSCGYYLNLAVEGFAHSLLTAKAPDFTLAYTLAASSRVLFDLFITFGMTITLYRSRSGVKQTDHVITLMILFIVNTNLLTTLLSISELVTFFALPTASIYGGLGFLTPKLYCNALLASMNSREFIQNELKPVGTTMLSGSGSTVFTARRGMGDFTAARLSAKGTVGEATRSGRDEEAQVSYEMTARSTTKLPYLRDDI